MCCAGHKSHVVAILDFHSCTQESWKPKTLDSSIADPRACNRRDTAHRVPQHRPVGALAAIQAAPVPRHGR